MTGGIAPQHSDLKAAFLAQAWPEMLQLYGVAEIPALCLELQDRDGVDVALLLVLVLADHAGLGATDSELTAVIAGAAAWREGVILPLRTARITLRDHTDDPDDRALRAAVKRVEIDAEQRHVARLAAALPDRTGTGARLSGRYLSGFPLSAAAREDALRALADGLVTTDPELAYAPKDPKENED